MEALSNAEKYLETTRNSPCKVNMTTTCMLTANKQVGQGGGGGQLGQFATGFWGEGQDTIKEYHKITLGRRRWVPKGNFALGGPEQS